MRRRALMVGLAAPTALALVATAQQPACAEPGLTSLMTPVEGQGIGHLSLSPTAQHPEFWAQGEVSIRGGLPSRSYILQRAIDHTPGNGTCDIAATPPDGWITLATLTTSPAGAGAAHFVRHVPSALTGGPQFDVVARLMTADGTQLLTSRCLTVTVK